MTLKQIFSRITGNATRLPAVEAELQRIAHEGDETRKRKDFDQALTIYNDGLVRARTMNSSQGEEIFLGLLGATYTELKRFEEAYPLLEQALESATKSAQDYRRARALLNLGAYYLSREDYSPAQKHLDQALTLAKQSNDSLTAALAVANLSDVYLRQNNPTYALKLLRETAPQFIQNSRQASMLMGRMGQAYLAQGELDRSRKCLVQAVELAVADGQTDQELLWSGVLADMLFKEGRAEDALRYYRRFEDLSAQGVTSIGQLPEGFTGRLLINQAISHQRLGHFDKAMEFAQSALLQARTLKDSAMEASAMATIGNVQRTAGKTQEAINTYRETLTLLADHPNAPDRVQIMVALGSLLQDEGDTDGATALFDQVLELAGDSDRIGRAQTLRQIGAILHKRGDLAGALGKWQAAFDLFDYEHAYAHMARLLCDIGAVRRVLSGIKAALEDYEQATVLLNSIKDSVTRGAVLSNVANIYTDLGEIETAQSFYQESIHLARETANRRAESLRLGNFGWFYVMTGQPAQGQRLIEEALDLSRQLGDDLVIAVQLNNLAQAYHEQKDFTRALTTYDQAIALIEKLNEPRWLAMFRSNLAKTKLSQGETDKALHLLEESLPISRKENDQETLTRTLARLGEIYLKLDRVNDADTVAREAEIIAKKWGYRKGTAEALVVRAGVAQAKHDDTEYTRHLQEAQRLYQILHDPIAQDLARLLGE